MEILKEMIKISDPEFPIRASYIQSPLEDLSSKPHLHKEIELAYLSKGEMEFTINNETICLHSGDIILINGLTAHSTSSSDNGQLTEQYLLQFNPSLILENNQLSEYKYLAPFLNESNFGYRILNINESSWIRNIADLIVEIATEIKQKDLAYEMSIKACLYKILTNLYRNDVIHFSSLGSMNKNEALLKKLDNAFKLVENHYNEDISVETVCRELSLNYHYFCRTFKAATGKTFIQYLNFVRIKNVEKLLLNTDKSIIQIMSETGFSSLNYFNKVFKRYKGVTPSAYRKEILKKSSIDYVLLK